MSRPGRPDRNYRDNKESRSAQPKDRSLTDRAMGDRSIGERGPRDRGPMGMERSDRGGDPKGKTSMQIQQSKAKDPMKMAGQKSSIKLTLRVGTY